MPEDKTEVKSVDEDFEDLRPDIANLAALCEIKGSNDKASVMELSMEAEGAKKGDKTKFMSVPVEFHEVKDGVGFFWINAGDLRAAISQLFPQITPTEISLAKEKLTTPKKVKSGGKKIAKPA